MATPEKRHLNLFNSDLIFDMKNKITLSLLLTCIYLSAYAQDDMTQLTKRVDNLEKDLFTYKVIAWAIATFTAFSIASLWLWARKNTERIITGRANAILEDKFGKHPVFAQYQKEQKAKQSSIFMIGEKQGHVELKKQLKNNGFEQVEFYPISEIYMFKTNKHDLIFFNDENGTLTQTQMDEIVDKYPEQMMFYYNTTRKRFENKKAKMAGFANSKETLAKRLLEALQ